MKIKNKRVIMSVPLWLATKAMIRQFLNGEYVDQFEQNSQDTSLKLKGRVP